MVTVHKVFLIGNSEAIQRYIRRLLLPRAEAELILTTALTTSCTHAFMLPLESSFSQPYSFLLLMMPSCFLYGCMLVYKKYLNNAKLGLDNHEPCHVLAVLRRLRLFLSLMPDH